MRVFTASLAMETNTFSPMLTGREAFMERSYFPPGKYPNYPTHIASPLWVLRRVSKEKGWTVIEGLVASAQPAGNVVKKVYEEFRDDILAQLKAAMPVDMVILGLHGAMVADGYDDCEGDVLKRVRDLVGPNVVVSSELDPHCHMTDLMVKSADLLICYKEFPHTDYLERAEELVAISEQIAKKKVKPTPALFDCRMINSYPTSREPMRSFVDRVPMEGKDGILSISPVHCYPYADVADIGTKMLVYTDNDPKKAADLARKLGEELISLRDTVRPEFLSIDQALDKGIASNSGPVVIAEPADNPGGGAPSDSTFVLKRMIERGIRDAAIAPIWDPIAVKQCFAAGEGGSFDLRFGGKMGAFSGSPVDAKVKVIKCVHNATQSQGPTIHHLGDAASIELEGGIAVVLITIRQQAWGPDLFSNLGIDPKKRKIVVVKSTNHFFAEYSKIAHDVLYMDGPGALPRNFNLVPYTKVKRPIWPLDANPWG